MDDICGLFLFCGQILSSACIVQAKDINKMKKSIIEKSSIFLSLLLVFVLGTLFTVEHSGGMKKINAAVVRFCKECAGYTQRIHTVDTKEEDLQVLPLLGTGILEQTIFFGEEIQEQKQLMFGIKMATYARKNNGILYVELEQGEQRQCYQMELEQVQDHEEMRLLFYTGQFQAGEVLVRIYAPESTGENCVAVYAVGNTKVYCPLVVNGEETSKNAVINSYIPSKYAHSDFVLRRKE